MTRSDIERAMISGDLVLVRNLAAAHGIAIRLEDDANEMTSLHLAALAGHEALVDLLLSPAFGCDPTASRNNRFTPLHAAAMHGRAAICGRLIGHGAAVNAQTSPQGYTPLHSAAYAGHLDAIRVLLANGSDRTLLNYRGETPEATARRQGQLEAAQTIRAVADPSRTSPPFRDVSS